MSDAARRVVQNSELRPDDVQEVLHLCRKYHGLALPEGSEAPEAVRLDDRHIPTTEAEEETTHLVGIKQAIGVNTLSTDAELVFESSGLTVIYGDNGSGKSGYARILKRACRARDRGRAIEPDIYASPRPSSTTAKLAYERSGTRHEYHWNDANDAPASELSHICIFDEGCASVHLKSANEVAFRPFGLDIPDRLSSLFEAVAAELSQEKSALECSRANVFLNPTWKPTTAVGRAISRLSAGTDLQNIGNLAEMSNDKRGRLEQLRKDLAADPAITAKQLRAVVQAVRTLRSRTTNALGGTSDERLEAVRVAARTARAARDAATAAAAGHFDAEPLSGIGGEAWQELWKSARSYSESGAYPNQPFPVVGDDARCVLCQQGLGEEAAARLKRFDEFVRDETEVRAQEAERQLAALLRALRELELKTNAVRDQLRSVTVESEHVAAAARRALVIARARRRSTLRALAHADTGTMPGAEDPSAALDGLIDTLDRRAKELEVASSDEERKKLLAELDELADRERLGELIGSVEDEIKRLKSLAAVNKCMAALNTRPVTELGNALAKDLLTDQLRDRFADELGRLAEGRVRAELVYAGGRRGNPRYQVRLVAKPSSDVAAILSEGEQTCVAIASFLTELSTASHRSTIVFDDPVSSLDHRWRLRVANRLVEEAKHRPVVVFTHDIVFVHDLDHRASDEDVGCTLRTIQRDATRTGLVTDGLPWKAKRVEHRIDELEKRARSCKAMHEAQDDESYSKAARDVYDDLRATWERSLEEVAFQRIIVRHRDYVDTKHLKKVSVLTETDCDTFRTNYGRCCDVVKGHDPSPGRNAPVPPPSQLDDDIRALKDWVAGLRDRHKSFD